MWLTGYLMPPCSAALSMKQLVVIMLTLTAEAWHIGRLGTTSIAAWRSR